MNNLFNYVPSYKAMTLLATISLSCLNACSNIDNNANALLSQYKLPQTQLTCITPQVYANKVIADGHCVSLIKKCAGAPMTSEWRAGKSVLNHQNQLPLEQSLPHLTTGAIQTEQVIMPLFT